MIVVFALESSGQEHRQRLPTPNAGVYRSHTRAALPKAVTGAQNRLVRVSCTTMLTRWSTTGYDMQQMPARS